MSTPDLDLAWEERNTRAVLIHQMLVAELEQSQEALVDLHKLYKETASRARFLEARLKRMQEKCDHPEFGIVHDWQRAFTDTSAIRCYDCDAGLSIDDPRVRALLDADQRLKHVMVGPDGEMPLL